MTTLSIIIPVLNEGEHLAHKLDLLQPLRSQGVELVVVDGGSRDDTVAQAQGLADQVLSAPRGRASQMNTGARAACGQALLFLHADTVLPPRAHECVLAALALQTQAWGRFDVRIDSQQPILAVVSWAMNTRSRWTGIATGDQAMFMHRSLFERVGGFPDLPLMEDIAISRRLKRLGRPLCLRERASTSARRWEQHGVWRTIWLMWRLRAAFFLGADPHQLARHYGYVPRETQT
ncbi:MAG: glycosyl transferase [Ideonella sp. MAG2]|nr:MAG: glycosyl transferase [Ideonella sp. MAG2]